MNGLNPSCTVREFREVVEPWLRGDPATFRVCEHMSWPERFLFLSDYAGEVVQRGTLQLQEYKRLWERQRQAKEQLHRSLYRGALLIGAESLGSR